MTSRLPAKLLAQLAALADRLGPLAEPLHGWLAGGWAVHYHTAHRMSGSVDISWSHKVAIPRDLQAFEISDPGRAIGRRVVIMDGGIGDVMGSYPPEWEERSSAIFGYGDMILHVMDPVDLAVSKLGRLDERDQGDIHELARAGLVDAELFGKRAREALACYVGNCPFVRDNLRAATLIVTAGQTEGQATPAEPAEDDSHLLDF